MNTSFILNNTLYNRKFYPLAIIGINILPRLYGSTIKSLSYYDLMCIAAMMNRGWTIMPGFKTAEENGNITIKPVVNQFMLWCEYNETVTQYIAIVNFENGNIKLFNSNYLIAEFKSLSDMYDCMPQLNDTLPLTCQSYNNKQTDDNLVAVEFDNIEDEIDFRNTNVYNDDLSASDFKFILDKDKVFEEDFVGKA